MHSSSRPWQSISPAARARAVPEENEDHKYKWEGCITEKWLSFFGSAFFFFGPLLLLGSIRIALQEEVLLFLLMLLVLGFFLDNTTDASSRGM